MIAAICVVLFLVPRIHWPIFGRLLPLLHAVSRDMRLVFLDITGLSKAMVAAFASNLLLVAAAFALAWGAGIDVGVVSWLVVMSVVLLVSALPISIGGWGTRELAMVYMLGLFAVPPDLAAAVSIQFGLCSTIASLVGAPVWAMLDQNRARPVPERQLECPWRPTASPCLPLARFARPLSIAGWRSAGDFLLYCLFVGGFVATLAFFSLVDVYDRHFFESSYAAIYNAFRVIFAAYFFWLIYVVGRQSLSFVPGDPLAGMRLHDRLALGFFVGAAVLTMRCSCSAICPCTGASWRGRSPFPSSPPLIGTSH